MRSLVNVEYAEGGFLALCDCAISTHVVVAVLDEHGQEIRELAKVGKIEAAFTCDGCGTSHWFTMEGH